MRQAVRSSWFVRAGVIGLLASCVWLVRPAAQEPEQAAERQQPVFRGAIDAVSVDVIVTDRNGRPVTDLTAADFEVREAGVPQTLTSFRLVETGDGVDDPRAAREILTLADERTETGRLDNRLFVVFLDDYHVRRGNSMRVRQQLADFLQQLSRNDLVAIATPLSSVSGLTFSRNHTVTSRTVMGFEGRKYDYTPRHPIEYRYQQLPIDQQEQLRNTLTLNALQSICEHLGTLREGRKSLLYVSEGLSASLPAGTMVVGQGGAGRIPVMGPQSSMQESMDFFDNASLMGEIERRVFRTATQNNVAVYTLDPRGLAAFSSDVSDDISLESDRRNLQDSLSVLRTIAEQTDGRAIVGRNDPMPDLRQMVRDAGTYYLLGYTSNRSPRDGRFQEIRVRVNRRDVQVRARKGYWAYSPEDVARAAAPARPESPAEVTQALDTLHTASVAGRSRSVAVWMGVLPGPAEQAAVTFAWEAPAAAPSSASDVVDRVSIVATTPAGNELFRGPVSRRADAGRGAGTVTFMAPAGPLRVRVVPENAAGLRLDVDDVSLDVPDFTGTGPRLTTPFLYRGRTARDLQQVRQAEAPLPVVNAVFARAERMLIRFGAYGAGGTTPRLTMRLLNHNGDQLAALPPPASPNGDLFESELGFGSFPPGEYLIEIAAEQSGESVKKLVAVRVTG